MLKSCLHRFLLPFLLSLPGKNEASSLARINKPAFIFPLLSWSLCCSSSLPHPSFLLFSSTNTSSPPIFGPSPASFRNAFHYFYRVHILSTSFLDFILTFAGFAPLQTVSCHHHHHITQSFITHSHHVQHSYHCGSCALPSRLDPGQSFTCAYTSQHDPTFTTCPQLSHPSPWSSA